MVVKRIYTLFWETVGKMWDPFWSLKTTWKTLDPAPALYTSSFDRKCKFVLVNRRSAGLLWRGAGLENIGQIGIKLALGIHTWGQHKSIYERRSYSSLCLKLCPSSLTQCVWTDSNSSVLITTNDLKKEKIKRKRTKLHQLLAVPPVQLI